MHPRIAELVAYVDAETEKPSRLYETIPAECRAVPSARLVVQFAGSET